MSEYRVACDVKPGDSIPWGSLNASGSVYTFGRCECQATACKREQTITMIDLATFGDYDNSTEIERSNHRVMRERWGEVLVYVHGSHGSEGLGYLGDFEDLPEDLREAIGALADYPILDESDASEIEMEMVDRAWDDWGLTEFTRQYHGRADLSTVLDERDPGYEHDATDLPASDVSQIWYQGCETYNVNGGNGYVIEGGGGVHFYIDEWIKRAREPEDARYPWSDWARNARRVLDDALLRAARACRGSIKPGADAAIDERVNLALVAMHLGLAGEQAPAGLIAQCDAPDADAWHVLADYLRERVPPAPRKRPRKRGARRHAARSGATT